MLATMKRDFKSLQMFFKGLTSHTQNNVLYSPLPTCSICSVIFLVSKLPQNSCKLFL